MTLKSCLFGIFKLTRNEDKSIFSCNGLGKAFDGKGYWNFDNDIARNVVSFGVGNSSWSHIGNLKNKFLVLGEGLTKDCWWSRKKISINFSKANTKLWLDLHYNGNESYLYVNKTESYEFKVKDDKSLYNFCLASISKDFAKDEQSEISVNVTLYHFPADQSSIKKRHS